MNDRLSLRRSLYDPVVLAAFMGLVGGGVTLGTGRVFDDAQRREQLRFEKQEAVCKRAFDFLQDEAVNPKLSNDETFYQKQYAIAQRCSRRTE